MTKTRLQISMALAIATLIWVPSTQAQDEPTVQSIIKMHIKSIGDLDKIKAVKTMVTEATMQIPSPGGELEANMKRVQAGDKFLMVMDLPQFGEITNGSNGDIVWSINPMQGARILQGAELEAAKNQMPEPFPAITWMDDFDGEISMDGSEDVDGNDTYKLVFAPTEGPKVTRYFDQKSGRILKMETTQPSPAGEMTIAVFPKDYKTVAGLSIPHTQITETPQGELTMTINNLEINSDLDEDTFALPEDVKDLVDDE